MKKFRIALVFALLASLLSWATVFAQEESLTLQLTRDFGYGGLNGDIQGAFSLKATGPANLKRVDFYIDEKKIGEVSAAPFKIQFVTDDYSAGVHSFSAVGTTLDGQQLNSQKITANFVSKSDAGKGTFQILLPILVITFGAILITAVVPLVMGRKTISLEPGTKRNYPIGGGICPKCARPFAFHMFGINLIGAKYDRCPYCGKWSIVKHVSIAQLHKAELAELVNIQAQVPEISEEEKLKQDLENSKFQNN